MLHRLQLEPVYRAHAFDDDPRKALVSREYSVKSFLEKVVCLFFRNGARFCCVQLKKREKNSVVALEEYY